VLVIANSVSPSEFSFIVPKHSSAFTSLFFQTNNFFYRFLICFSSLILLSTSIFINNFNTGTLQLTRENCISSVFYASYCAGCGLLECDAVHFGMQVPVLQMNLLSASFTLIIVRIPTAVRTCLIWAYSFHTLYYFSIQQIISQDSPYFYT
jgi:hypothetical protein